ncbi:UNVERIFIED_CONTAM: hypothetical protein Sangu_2872200 [Sesamum angustifolium]|uniref:DUF4283 domain-containing protein n=1 Tax=Sesamum angustifolium TaxID=2727405 RepID=A0AAW2INX0_9LAMI
MVPFRFNSDEFPPLTQATHPNSPESTRSVPTQQSTSKSFCDAIADKRYPLHHTAELKNFYLANSNSPQIGTVDFINGRHTVSFSDSETQALAACFHLTLIGKFSQGSPPYSQLHHLLSDLGLKGKFTVSLINSKHFLITLTNESDYSRLWLRRIWYLKGLPMRVFKWSPTFSPTQESSIVPVWVSLPELPAHLFRKDVLFVIAKIIGMPLQINNSTANQSKFLKVRVCVEIDLLKPMPQEVDLQICDETIVQKLNTNTFRHIIHYAIMWGIKTPRATQKKGNEVVQADHKVFEEMTVRNTPTTEKGECSKMTVIQQRYDPVSGTKNAEHIETEIIENNEVDHAIEVNNGCDENHFAATEIDAKDPLGTVCELEESRENIVKPIDTVGTLIIRPNNFVCDLMRGKKRIKVDSVLRIFQTLKHVGVVIKGIKKDVEVVIKRNRLAVSSAILL